MKTDNVPNTRSIPSLDGLRALAILAVVFGHSRSAFMDKQWWLSPFRNGTLGVVGFFVLSGFLITGILLREENKTGTINLKMFYVRRSFRIFPAFYTFLLVVACLGFAHIVFVDLTSWLAAATYTWNYTIRADSYTLSQTWSLSLEEQFYLFWPLCLILLKKRTCLFIAIGSIVLSPFSRVLTYALFPALRGQINMMFHTHIDAIMTGSAIALAQDLGLFSNLLSSLAKARWTVLAALYFLVQPLLVTMYRGAYSLTLGMTLDELMWGIVLLHVVRFPNMPMGKFLNWPLVAHIGRISYSIYLWQQLFVGPNQRTPFPLNLLWILLCAESSYWFVEQPFLRLREKITGKRNRLENRPSSSQENAQSYLNSDAEATHRL